MFLLIIAIHGLQQAFLLNNIHLKDRLCLGWIHILGISFHVLRVICHFEKHSMGRIKEQDKKNIKTLLGKGMSQRNISIQLNIPKTTLQGTQRISTSSQMTKGEG